MNREHIIQEPDLLVTKLDDGQIEVREGTKGFYHRHVILPGQSLAEEDPRLRSKVALLHVPAVVDAFWEAERARELKWQTDKSTT